MLCDQSIPRTIPQAIKTYSARKPTANLTRYFTYNSSRWELACYHSVSCDIPRNPNVCHTIPRDPHVLRGSKMYACHAIPRDQNMCSCDPMISIKMHPMRSRGVKMYRLRCLVVNVHPMRPHAGSKRLPQRSRHNTALLHVYSSARS